MTFGAVIFDLGGVLIAEGEPIARRAREADLGLRTGQLDELVRDAVGPGWLGGRTADEIRERLSASTGVSLDQVAALMDDFHANAYLDPLLVSFALGVRGRLRVAALSNAGPDLREVMTRKFRLDRLVDLLVVSAEERIQKPDPAIYERTAQRLGVPPAKCVFVDDVQANVDGAHAVGMTALLHQNSPETIRKLDLLIMSGQTPADRPPT